MQVSFTEGLRLRLGDTSLFLTIACEPLNIVCGLHWRAFIGGLPLPLVRRALLHCPLNSKPSRHCSAG